jgi:hypothetical protein
MDPWVAEKGGEVGRIEVSHFRCDVPTCPSARAHFFEPQLCQPHPRRPHRTQQPRNHLRLERCVRLNSSFREEVLKLPEPVQRLVAEESVDLDGVEAEVRKSGLDKLDEEDDRRRDVDGFRVGFGEKVLPEEVASDLVAEVRKRQEKVKYSAVRLDLEDDRGSGQRGRRGGTAKDARETKDTKGLT